MSEIFRSPSYAQVCQHITLSHEHVVPVANSYSGCTNIQVVSDLEPEMHRTIEASLAVGAPVGMGCRD